MNKYKITLLILFLIILFSVNQVNAYVNDFPLLGKTIYLDAGHGGKDPGAIYDNVYEKDINLDIVKKLQFELEKMGAVVLLTRDDDYDLASIDAKKRKQSDLLKRANLINESKCDMYISIHLNAYSSTKWSGLQIFYDDINPNNKILAEIMNETLKSNLKTVREIKRENGYFMYHKINVPGILIESGFITNSNDRYKLKDSNYQAILARNIVLGVINYFSK
ncbi:n-acetylmuramoyl-L-alanine amidase CwlD [Clostridium sp. CAG:762]|nr:n-acetylmuramoyl-L-alanine amidase CwlD [Clostridium sp. CAG:762]